MKHIWIVVIGITFIAIGQLSEKVITKIAMAVHQASASGSYSDSLYALNLRGYNTLCLVIIVIGLVAVVIEEKRT